MKTAWQLAILVPVVVLFTLTCSEKTTQAPAHDNAHGLIVPVIQSPIVVDSTAMNALQKGQPVTVTVNNKAVTITLLPVMSGSGASAGEQILSLETGKDTTTFFKKVLVATPKMRAASLSASDSLLGTWRAFMQEINGSSTTILDDNSNCIEVIISQTGTSGGSAVEITMQVTGTPEISHAQNHSPYFLSDSVSMSAKMDSLEIGTTYHFKIQAHDSDAGDQWFLTIHTDSSTMPDISMKDDTLIWHVTVENALRNRGYHGLMAEVHDVAGLSANLNWSVHIINKPPHFIDDSASLSRKMDSLRVDKTYLFTVRASDPDSGDSVSIKFTWPLQDTALYNHSQRGDTLVWKVLQKQTGRHTLSATAYDKAFDSVTIHWSACVLYPLFAWNSSEWSIQFGGTRSAGQLFKAPIKGSGPDSARLTYALLSGPTGATIVHDSLIWQSAKSDSGTFNFSLQAFDGARYDTVSFTARMASFLTSKTAPLMSMDTNQTKQGKVGKRTNWTVNAMNYNQDDSLEFTLLQGPAGLTLITGYRYTNAGGNTSCTDTISWTPSISDTGRHPLQIKVTNTYGLTDTVQTIIIVSDTNHSPIFVSRPEDLNSIAIVGSAYKDTIRIVDPEGDSLRVQVTDSNGNLVRLDNDSVISFSPTTSDIGAHKIAFTASDFHVVNGQSFGLGPEVRLAWTITVKDSNRAPEFLAPVFNAGLNKIVYYPTSFYHNDTAYCNKTNRDTMHASDINGDTLSFSFIRSVPGMTITDSIVTWTPTNAQAGLVDSVFVKVSDGKGKSDTVQWNIRAFLEMSIVGSCVLPAIPTGMAMSGNYVYLADMDSGLVVVDISNSAAPFIAGRLGTGGKVMDVAVSGAYAYLVADNLKVVDISTPTLPTMAGSNSISLSTYSSYDRVEAAGNYVYVATQYQYDYAVTPPAPALVIFDASNPASPVEIARIGHSSAPGDFSIQGGKLYVIDGGFFNVIDVAVPSAPSVIGSIPMIPSVSNTAVSGNYAYVLCNDMKIIDVGNPANPAITDSIAMNGSGICVAGDYAFATAQGTIITSANIKDPYKALYTGGITATYGSTDGLRIIASGSTAYVATRDKKLDVIKINLP
jgi:hypothetical protein